ncbi:hypothetical protein C8A00DRAFT_29392 [Chaetomidium leptoderma]|uniref:Uncharacterized protein n=1 Tax=Chaetomidium leptoderma TaxID=669021 RepID=A0AAN6VTV9_9PEZI|nr:hypothetical protein C8A00DRAFT_29392 [Chaetomidium leptoderma]
MGKLRWGVKHPPADPTVSFAGKTVLVTGANTGLGLEAAVKYATLGDGRAGQRALDGADGGSTALVRETSRSSSPGPESHGRFWHHDILHPIGDLAKDETLMRQTWDEIFKVVVVAEPGLQQILATQN